VQDAGCATTLAIRGGGPHASLGVAELGVPVLWPEEPSLSGGVCVLKVAGDPQEEFDPAAEAVRTLRGEIVGG
jgi:hypothetical protein